MRAIVGLAVVAAAIIAVVVVVMVTGDDSDAPPVAVAALQDDHLPVDPIEEVPARLDLLAETGVTTTRVDLFWGDIAPARPESPRDPAAPVYDFSRADLIMLGLEERGITPIVSVFNTPSWAVGGRVEPEGARVNTLTPEAEDFADFMAAVAARYSGSFDSPGGETLPEVRHFELWNEPNLSGFLRPQFEGDRPVSLDAYADMVRRAYPLIKRANPDAEVIVGVGGPRSSTGETGIGAIDWLRGLQERDVPLDAYSQHIYPAAGPQVETDVVPSWNTVDRLLDELDGFRPGLPLYITEAGYTTAATRFRDTPGASEEEQAEFLRQIFALPQLQTGRVRAVVWFNLQDNVDWPAGLLREDGSRKPSYEAFREVVRAQGGARIDGG